MNVFKGFWDLKYSGRQKITKESQFSWYSEIFSSIQIPGPSDNHNTYVFFIIPNISKVLWSIEVLGPPGKKKHWVKGFEYNKTNNEVKES